MNKKEEEIEYQLNSGKLSFDLNNITNIDDYQIHKIMCDNFAHNVKSPKLLPEICNPENSKKFKHRFQSMISFNNESNEPLVKLQIFKLDPYELKNLLKYEANVLDCKIDNNTAKDKYNSQFVKLMKLANINTNNMEVLQSGIINQINVKIVYRKG